MPLAEFLTMHEAAALLGVSRSTLGEWERSGRLAADRHPITGQGVYRRESLETLLGERSVTDTHGGPPAARTSIDWPAIGPNEHFVQFYEADEILVDSVSNYVAQGLAAGEGVLLIVKQSRRKGIFETMRQRGLELTEACERGQCFFFDAEETLTRFLHDGRPDLAKLGAFAEPIIGELLQQWPRIRVFGEMAALLWTCGNHEEAYQFEGYWDALAKRHEFSLYCAYPLDGFQQDASVPSLTDVCACHRHVIPAESYTMLSTGGEQLRTVALLQQKALRLESEVADRKRADRDRALLASIIESSEDAILSKSVDGTIRSWNLAAQRLFGYTEREVVGKPITIIIPPERIAEEEHILRRLREGERIEHYETVRFAKDGRRIQISLTVSPLRDSEGHLIGASSIARDITERKRAEAERARLLAAERVARAEADAAQRRYRELVDGLEAIVWEADAETWQFTFINQRAEEILGYPRERWLGEPGFWATIIHPDDRDFAVNLCASATAQCRDHDFEYRAIAADGRVVWMRDIVYVVRGSDGRAQHLRGLMIDITAMKRTEAALKEADRRKDEFLATLAHELRNPLAPISNGLQVLKLINETDNLSEETREIHDMIERQVGHMVRLIDDLLEFSRISRGKIHLKRERVAVDAFVRHALETSKPLMDEGSHRLEVDLPQQPIVVDGDPIRLAQVVSNLLNNAAKYTDPGGPITLTASRHGDEAVLSVRDTGIGIERSMLPRVFDMFAQIENPLRSGQEGLGIGLSLVRALVQMHGGSVEARSDGLGLGSEFIVRLPVVFDSKPAAENRTSSAEETPRSTSMQRVLVVDDNRDAADTLARILKLQGCSVRAVYDGPSALRAIATDRPEIVFLDLGMPGMNGYEVARQIREDPRNEPILLIALTGWGQNEHRRRSCEAGFDHHLVKPVALDALQTLLRRD